MSEHNPGWPTPTEIDCYDRLAIDYVSDTANNDQTAYVEVTQTPFERANVWTINTRRSSGASIVLTYYTERDAWQLHSDPIGAVSMTDLGLITDIRITRRSADD